MISFLSIICEIYVFYHQLIQLVMFSLMVHVITWLSEIFAEHAGTTKDLLSEQEAINVILSLNPAVDTQYMNQKLKVIIIIINYYEVFISRCFIMVSNLSVYKTTNISAKNFSAQHHRFS